jgi:hypothetical protein
MQQAAAPHGEELKIVTDMRDFVQEKHERAVMNLAMPGIVGLRRPGRR